jgi:flagellin-like protein
MKRGKKAVSPMIATVILIAIVVVLAMIIFLGMSAWVKEAIVKNLAGEEKSVQAYCSEITLTPILNEDGTFGFTNTGNVPIYAIKLKLTQSGTSTVKRISSESSEAGGFPFGPGSSASLNDYNRNDYEEVKIIPILIGTGKKSGGTQEFVCPEENSLEII